MGQERGRVWLGLRWNIAPGVGEEEWVGDIYIKKKLRFLMEIKRWLLAAILMGLGLGLGFC